MRSNMPRHQARPPSSAADARPLSRQSPHVRRASFRSRMRSPSHREWKEHAPNRPSRASNLVPNRACRRPSRRSPDRPSASQHRRSSGRNRTSKPRKPRVSRHLASNGPSRISNRSSNRISSDPPHRHRHRISSARRHRHRTSRRRTRHRCSTRRQHRGDRSRVIDRHASRSCTDGYKKARASEARAFQLHERCRDRGSRVQTAIGAVNGAWCR